MLLGAGFFRKGRKGFPGRRPGEIGLPIAGGILDVLNSIHYGELILLRSPTTLREKIRGREGREGRS